MRCSLAPTGTGVAESICLLLSLDQSLKRMDLEYLDIFYYHRMDLKTSPEETMGALASAVQSEKVLYVGCPIMTVSISKQAAAILNELKVPFVINQNCYSIFERMIKNNGLKKTAAKLGKGIITFSPLAQMVLAWVLHDGIVASVLVGVSRLEQILDNIEAADNMNFTADVLVLIEKISAEK